MRELKFRAKTLSGLTVYIIGVGNYQWFTKNGRYYGDIDHKTTEQCVGQKCKGKDLYEGDIVKEGGNVGVMKWDDDHAKFICDLKTGSSGLYLQQMKIIGNTIDNPELIA